MRAEYNTSALDVTFSADMLWWIGTAVMSCIGDCSIDTYVCITHHDWRWSEYNRNKRRRWQLAGDMISGDPESRNWVGAAPPPYTAVAELFSHLVSCHLNTTTNGSGTCFERLGETSLRLPDMRSLVENGVFSWRIHDFSCNQNFYLCH